MIWQEMFAVNTNQQQTEAIWWSNKSLLGYIMGKIRYLYQWFPGVYAKQVSEYLGIGN